MSMRYVGLQTIAACMAMLISAVPSAPAAQTAETVSNVTPIRADHPAIKMAANSWLEIPNTKMKTVTPSDAQFPHVWGVCGPRSIMGAWSGAALDSKRSRLIVFGGGHADYAGNEVYAFDINKLSWERLTDPFPDPKADNTDENPDGTPQSRHTYGGLAYLAHADRFFALGGSIYQSGNMVCNKVWTLDLATKKWTRAKDKVPFKPAFDCSCAYDPLTKKLWFCNFTLGCEAELWCYEYDEDKWSKPKTDYDFGYHGAALDTKRGLLVVLSGGSGPCTVKAHNVRGQSPEQTWKTTGGDEFLKQHEVGFEYDPVADKFVGWAGDTPDKVFVLDPEKKEWTVNSPPGAPSKPATAGTFGRWRYVPSINAFILASGIDADIYFYKLTAGAGNASSK